MIVPCRLSKHFFISVWNWCELIDCNDQMTPPSAPRPFPASMSSSLRPAPRQTYVYFKFLYISIEMTFEHFFISGHPHRLKTTSVRWRCVFVYVNIFISCNVFCFVNYLSYSCRTSLVIQFLNALKRIWLKITASQLQKPHRAPRSRQPSLLIWVLELPPSPRRKQGPSSLTPRSPPSHRLSRLRWSSEAAWRMSSARSTSGFPQAYFLNALFLRLDVQLIIVNLKCICNILIFCVQCLIAEKCWNIFLFLPWRSIFCNIFYFINQY